MEREVHCTLTVENVQALASKNLKDVPLRYIRPELESDQISDDYSLQVPVIDMSKLVGSDPLSSESESARLHSACKNWGFFQLTNHGVPEEVIWKVKEDIKGFFKLPLEEKMDCAQLPNNNEGYGQTFVFSQDQKLDWGDMLLIVSLPVCHRNFRFWPSSPPSFRATMGKYSAELERVATSLLKPMAKNLGIDSTKLASLFEDGSQGMRMNYYPPCAEANKVMGLTQHSDATGLTLLIQVNEVQGLQIKKNGKWAPIKPLPNAFIVNIGDIIEILSNGEYKSIEHRAMVSPENERLSVAAFHGPNTKTMIGPLPDLVKDNTPNYKTLTHDDFFRLVMNLKLDGKSVLSHMKFE